MAKTSVSVNGIGFSSLLLLLFIGLKLTGHIAWSWTWVLAPLWIPVSFGLALMAFALVMAVATGQLKRR
jgi:hypothetical protein